MRGLAPWRLTVMGIDPGSRHCGIGIVRGGVILHREDMRLNTDLTVACASLRLRILECIGAYQVAVIGFESFRFGAHATGNSAATLAITGVIRSLADQIPVRAYHVEEWRTAMVGEPPHDLHDRDAWKEVVQRAVRRQLGLPCEAVEADPGGHMYDALGIALFTAYDAGAELLGATQGEGRRREEASR